MNKILLVVLLLALTSSSFKNISTRKTILIVLAHPDDETSIGSVISKYVRNSKIVYIVATDGRYGTRVNKFSEDSLIKIRQQECECSCKQLGIDSPIFLNFTDGFGLSKGIGEYFKQTRAFKKILKEKIEEIGPDLIISFGPDGDTGHADHRLMGDILSEIILREAWFNKYPLYFLGWTKTQAARFGIEELNYADSSYFNVAIHFSQKDEDNYFEAIKCYKSQNTPEEIREWIDIEKKDSNNVLYFRKFNTVKGLRSEF